MNRRFLIKVVLLALTACSPSTMAIKPAVQPGPGESDRVLDGIVDRMVSHQLNFDPTLSYFSGLPAANHHRWVDRSPAALRVFQQEQDRLLADLRTIDANRLAPRNLGTHAILTELLEAESQSRICRAELWTVSHMHGWQLAVVLVAREQPVGTGDERTQALERWSALPQVIDQEIQNLRSGLAEGYSAPKSVVNRVIKQVIELAAPLDKSPLLSPAKRSEDADFKARFQTVIDAEVNPALRRYGDFLKNEYLPRARDELGVAANPNGVACYNARLRFFTTLNRTAEQVYQIGAAAVARNAATATELGFERFGTRDLNEIVRRVNDALDNRFGTLDELLAFSRQSTERARIGTGPHFQEMPTQVVLVEPFREFMRGSGASSHYETQVDLAQPAYFRIATDNWSSETRGRAEITAVHETFPGHHMQIASMHTLKRTPLAKLFASAAYQEGWARYSEMLAEEAGLYSTPYALITRRIWPARGMVADPGLHVLGWSREQTVKYMTDGGQSKADAEDLVDRMAIMPGQLTAYDSGGLEIMALREEARRALGTRFDIRDFHEAVLGGGILPLKALRARVENWVQSKRPGK
jgi:uncharacterized protein (DUF885 family)